jgi:DNA-binding NarL/FixJ family response regulator
MNKAIVPVKIIIADDHEIFREGFRSMLQHEREFDLVGEATNGEHLVDLCLLNKPDVILTDIKMPVMDGIEATKILNQKQPASAIIALTMCSEEYLIGDMLAAGAKGYLLKDAGKWEVLDAIKAVNNNQPYYCRATATTLTRLITKKQFNPDTNEHMAALSPRETEILILICEQKSTKQISKILNISKRTVDSFRTILLDKTESENMIGLVTFAVRNGIFNP